MTVGPGWGIQAFPGTLETPVGTREVLQMWALSPSSGVKEGDGNRVSAVCHSVLFW